MKKSQFLSFSNFKKEWLQDPDNKAAYDALEPQYRLMESMIRKRIERDMTQAQVAQKMGTTQSVIARVECGNGNPSFKFLQRMATALGGTLRVEIV